MKPTLGKAEKQLQIETRRVCVLMLLELGMYDKRYIDCAVGVKNASCTKPDVTRYTPDKFTGGSTEIIFDVCMTVRH